MLMDLGFKIPVLIFISVLALIKRTEAGREVLALGKQRALFNQSTLERFLLLGKSLLELSDLTEKRCGDLGCKFDVADTTV